MGHLQDQEELRLPAGHEEPLHELWHLLRDYHGLHSVLHPRHGQGLEDVPPQDQLVAACHPLLHPHLLLRRDEKVSPPSQPRWLDRAGDLLLSLLPFDQSALATTCLAKSLTVVPL